jgi:hypothetical protein
MFQIGNLDCAGAVIARVVMHHVNGAVRVKRDRFNAHQGLISAVIKSVVPGGTLCLAHAVDLDAKNNAIRQESRIDRLQGLISSLEDRVKELEKAAKPPQ